MKRITNLGRTGVEYSVISTYEYTTQSLRKPTNQFGGEANLSLIKLINHQYKGQFRNQQTNLIDH